MVWAILGALGIFHGVAFSEVKNYEFEASDMDSLQLSNGAGEVRILHSDSERITVAAEKVKFDENCELNVEPSGASLVVTAKAMRSWFRSVSCEVNFLIHLPEEIDLNLATGSGNINVTGVAGKVKVNTGSGNTSIAGDIKELDVRSGSGAIDVQGLSGLGEVRTGSGNIQITIDEVLAEGSLELRTGSGNATVMVPDQMSIMTELRVGSGRITNEVGDSPDSQFKVAMRAGSGNLTIKKSE